MKTYVFSGFMIVDLTNLNAEWHTKIEKRQLEKNIPTTTL